MVDINTFTASVIVGTIVTAIYIWRMRQAKQSPKEIELEAILTLFVRSAGLVGGASLMIYLFWRDIEKYFQVSPIHIFLGGLAVFYLSLKGILGDLKKAKL